MNTNLKKEIATNVRSAVWEPKKWRSSQPETGLLEAAEKVSRDRTSVVKPRSAYSKKKRKLQFYSPAPQSENQSKRHNPGVPRGLSKPQNDALPQFGGWWLPAYAEQQQFAPAPCYPAFPTPCYPGYAMPPGPYHLPPNHLPPNRNFMVSQNRRTWIEHSGIAYMLMEQPPAQNPAYKPPMLNGEGKNYMSPQQTYNLQEVCKKGARSKQVPLLPNSFRNQPNGPRAEPVEPNGGDGSRSITKEWVRPVKGTQFYMSVHKWDEELDRMVLRYRCTVCSKSFPGKSGMQAHIRTHTGERPFKCKYCNAAFAHRTNIRRHLLIHKRKGEVRDTKESAAQQQTAC
eukprot:CAMPEP_0184478394 /NCGR_PEP_ID=MMETSP0113_2-20130426/432_1 /TAXON_ID=91329 /ORGANISM="Norrisiella sphaerica, Strain BC52" /LENGTH=341 /DNA_ID=CAMNT_0026856169 /DNA_START=140 /DNA_END=1165 /DNA_ORIENTATION=+